jgi:hypothetical protein
MLKPFLLLVAAGWLLAGSVMGQNQIRSVEKYETFAASGSHVIEPDKEGVWIMPLVAELKILNNQERGEYGPYVIEIQSLEDLRLNWQSYKSRALYKASKEAKADLLVATLFNAKDTLSVSGNKAVAIWVSGYPAKYTNFHSANPEDIRWKETVYPAAEKTKQEATIKKETNTEIIKK